MSFFDDVTSSGLKLEKPILGMPVLDEQVFKATIREFKPDEQTKAGKPAMIMEFENAEAVVTKPEEGEKAATLPAGKVNRSIYFNPYPYNLKKENREETKEEVQTRITEQLFRWWANIYGDNDASFTKFQATLRKGAAALKEAFEGKSVFLGARISDRDGQRNNDFNPIKESVYNAKKAAQAVR